MTLGEAKIQAIQHMKEYSINGTLVSTSNGSYQDYVKTMNPAANTSQIELSKIAKIPAVHKISQNPITNLLGSENFKEVQHYPDTDLSYTGAGARSFSVDVDGECTIYFYETISGVLTAINGTYSNDGGTPTAFTGLISAPNTVETFTNYKGLLTISDASNTITMKIVATYPMKSRYRALFAYAYATALKVPRYSAYIPYDLPAGYMEFNKMMRSYDDRQFNENTDFILTPDNKVHINWNLTGQFDIHYWRFPTEITNDTLDTADFEVRQDAQALIPWFMGGNAIMTDNPSLGTQLLNQYYALKDMLSETDDLEITQMQAVWG